MTQRLYGVVLIIVAALLFGLTYFEVPFSNVILPVCILICFASGIYELIRRPNQRP